MATDYSFFEKTLFERRTYRFDWDWETDFAKPDGVDEKFSFLSRQKDNFIVRGTHVMPPSNPLGLAQVNERFNITLPRDMDDFYRRWNGGFLFFRRCYPLLSAKQMIEVAEEMRTIRKEPLPPQLPWHLIRFCDLGNGDYFALRWENELDRWKVVLASVETWDTDHIQGNEPHAGTDSDFYSWLRRICETDGWPECPPEESEESPSERIA